MTTLVALIAVILFSQVLVLVIVVNALDAVVDALRDLRFEVRGLKEEL